MSLVERLDYCVQSLYRLAKLRRAFLVDDQAIATSEFQDEHIARYFLLNNGTVCVGSYIDRQRRYCHVSQVSCRMLLPGTTRQAIADSVPVQLKCAWLSGLKRTILGEKATDDEKKRRCKDRADEQKGEYRVSRPTPGEWRHITSCQANPQPH